MIATLLAAMLAASTSCGWTVDRIVEGLHGETWAAVETPDARTLDVRAEYLPAGIREGSRLCVTLDERR